MDILFSDAEQVKLRDLEVVSIYLFGSRAQGMEGPLSDYDFGILMHASGSHRGDAVYDTLYDLLAPHCPRTLENDVIDIVFLHDAPLELRMHIVRYGKVLYDANPKLRLRFEERTQLEYADFKPILDEMDRVILKSL